MIVVTCARGKTGSAIASHLAKGGHRIRALVGHENSLADIAELGVAEAMDCDLYDAHAVEAALEGAEQLYYIAPNMNPAERSFGDNVISGARAARLRKVVFHSMLHTQIEDLPHHWERHYVEGDIISSGLRYVILQCGSYMQNMLPAWPKMLESGVHTMPYDINQPMSLVDLNDICEVAEKVLTSDDYDYGIYEICGEAITLVEKAEILTDVLGSEIRAEKEPLKQFVAHAEALGFSDYTIQTMQRMFPYYDKHGLAASPRVLEWMLGRPATDFRTFVERVAAG